MSAGIVMTPHLARLLSALRDEYAVDVADLNSEVGCGRALSKIKAQRMELAGARAEVKNHPDTVDRLDRIAELMEVVKERRRALSTMAGAAYERSFMVAAKHLLPDWQYRTVHEEALRRVAAEEARRNAQGTGHAVAPIGSSGGLRLRKEERPGGAA